MTIRQIDVERARELRAQNVTYRRIGMIVAQEQHREKPYSAAAVLYAVEGRQPRRKPKGATQSAR